MQERHQQNTHPQTLQQHNPLRNLLFRPNQLRLEAIVILHQILEFAISPHAVFVPRARARVLDLLAEALDSLWVRFPLDLGEHAEGFFLRVSADDEAVEGEVDLALAAGFLGAFFHVANLVLEAFERVAVHEVVVADLRGILFRVVGVAALEDLRVGSAGEDEGFGLEGVIVELVEVAFEGEGVLGPDAFEAGDEFAGAAVTLAVVKPPLAYACELWEMLAGSGRVGEGGGRVYFEFEPAGDDIDGDAAFAVVVYASNLLCGDCWVPWARE